MAIGKSPYDILKEYSQIITDSLRKSLVDNGRYASGGLSKSIEARMNVLGQTISIEVWMDGYWKFVDSGVSGTKVNRGSEYKFKKKNIPQSAALKHIANRGLNFKDLQNFYTNSKGLKVKRKKPLEKDKALKTLAFLLGRKISKVGFAPTNFVDEGIDGIEKQLERDLFEAVGRVIEIELTLK